MDYDIELKKIFLPDQPPTVGMPSTAVEAHDGLEQAIESDLIGLRALHSAGQQLHVLSSYVQGKSLTKSEQLLTRLAAESFCSNANQKLEPDLGFESLGGRVGAEGLFNGVQGILDQIGQRVAGSSEKIAALIQNLDTCLDKLQQKHSALSELNAGIDAAVTPRTNLIKAQPWCVSLCYLSSGFDVGLVNSSKDMEWLAKSYTSMTDASVAKFLKWYLKSKGSGLKAFDQLECSRDDFVMAGMGAARGQIPIELKESETLYQSKDLPGGVSFLVKTKDGFSKGVEVIDAILDTGYYRATTGTERLKDLSAKVLAISQMDNPSWMIAHAKHLGMNGQIAIQVCQRLNPNFVTQVNTVMDQRLVFKTMTRAEISSALTAVGAALGTWKQWNTQVLQERWKAGGVNQVIGETTQASAEAGANAHYLKAFCYALTELLMKHHFGAQAYSLKTLEAMLLYVERSIDQYRPG